MRRARSGCTADLVRSHVNLLLRLSGDRPGRLVCKLYGQLCDTTAVVDRRFQIVAHEIGLSRDKVLHGPAMRKHVEPVQISLQLILAQSETFTGEVLEAAGQDRAALGHGLDVEPGLARQLLERLAGEAENVRELIRCALGRIRSLVLLRPVVTGRHVASSLRFSRNSIDRPILAAPDANATEIGRRTG